MAEIVKGASDAGLEGVGISDHFFTSKVYRRTDPGKYLRENWPVYLSDTRKARANPPPGIAVWQGIEIDTCFSRVGMTLSELPWEDLNSLDYILIEYAGETDRGGMALERIGEFREHCRVPLILAHPDIDFFAENEQLGKLSDILERFEIALEIPGGSRNPWYWSRNDPGILARVALTIGTDTHERVEDIGAIGKALRFLEAKGLSARIADPVELKGRLDRFQRPGGG